MLYSMLYRFLSRHKRISKLRNRIIYSLWNGHKMSLWKSNFGSTYQNLPRYLKSLTFLFPWIAKAISMHQNVHWSFYSLPAEFFKNSVKMISSRLHLKFHQISNWQWNRKCIFLTIIPLICLFLRLGCVRTYTLVGGSSDLWNVVIFLMVNNKQ